MFNEDVARAFYRAQVRPHTHPKPLAVQQGKREQHEAKLTNVKK